MTCVLIHHKSVFLLAAFHAGAENTNVILGDGSIRIPTLTTILQQLVLVLFAEFEIKHILAFRAEVHGDYYTSWLDLYFDFPAMSSASISFFKSLISLTTDG